MPVCFHALETHHQQTVGFLVTSASVFECAATEKGFGWFTGNSVAKSPSPQLLVNHLEVMNRYDSTSPPFIAAAAHSPNLHHRGGGTSISSVLLLGLLGLVSLAGWYSIDDAILGYRSLLKDVTTLISFEAPIPVPTEPLCPQSDELVPVKNGAVWDAMDALLHTENFKETAVAWLSGAIKIP